MAASTSTTPNLASLPEELLANVAVRLGADDLASLRLTCKSIEARVLYDFAKEYFEEKCFMFTTASLNCLLNISKSEKLRPHLRHVYFITASFPHRALDCSHASCCCSWQPTIRQREAYIEYMHDQERLRKTKADLKLLTDAFTNLPALKALTFIDHLTALANETAQCYGYNKVTRTTNRPPSFAPVTEAATAEYFPWLTHVFQTVITALANSGIDSLLYFSTHFKNQIHGISPSSDLRLKQEVLDKLEHCFANLQSFSLQIRSQYLRYRRNDTEKDYARAYKYAKSFSAVLKAAQSARLEFDYLEPTGTICKAITTSLDFASLSNFSLENLCIDAKILGSIVCRLSSVEKLFFHAIDLTRGNWVSILKAVGQLPAVNHLHLQFLQQGMQKVYFLTQPQESDEASGVPTNNPFFESGALGDNEDDNWTEEEEEYGTDDEPPNLIAQELGFLKSQPKESDISKPDMTKKCLEYTGKDYKAPGRDADQERGYYVCLSSREEIEAELPTFIEQCNLGDSYDQGMDFGNLLNIPGLPNAGVVTLPMVAGGPGGNGPQGGLNAIMNQLNALLGPAGPPPPFVAPPNPPGANNANNNGPSQQNTQAVAGALHVPPTNSAPPSTLLPTNSNTAINHTPTETVPGDWVNDVD
ncbi:hypothetical protein AC578_3888 [Pseudocercospora eumusae]|uniref:F-box domain-containing protein n=1 Tax=Pseudocercospora eumusae TaxID=321146 RepID=A0A139GY43_9PEZI|nr:hypothetical protein AC578_3888 [Pseudocercospora eumusae]